MLQTLQSFGVIQHQQPLVEKLLEAMVQCEMLLMNHEAQARRSFTQDGARVESLDATRGTFSLGPFAEALQVLPACGKGIAPREHQPQQCFVVAVNFTNDGAAFDSGAVG